MKTLFKISIVCLFLLPNCATSTDNCYKTILFNNLCDSLLFDKSELEIKSVEVKLNDNYLKNSCIIFSGKVFDIDDSGNVNITYSRTTNRIISNIIKFKNSDELKKCKVGKDVTIKATYDYGIKTRFFKEDYTFYFKNAIVTNDISGEFNGFVDSLINEPDYNPLLFSLRANYFKNKDALIYATIWKISDDGKIYFRKNTGNVNSILSFEFNGINEVSKLMKGQYISVFGNISKIEKINNNGEKCYYTYFNNSIVTATSKKAEMTYKGNTVLGSLYMVGGVNLYITSTITKEESERLAQYLITSGFTHRDTTGNHYPVQLNKVESTYQFRFIVKEGMEFDENYIKSTKSFIKDLSEYIFDNNKVELHLCNSNFETIRIVNY